MERTTNYGLYKPGSDDFISVDDLNANMDIIDEALANRSGGNTPVSAMLVANSAGTPVIGNAELNQTVINLFSADFEQGNIVDGEPVGNGLCIRTKEFIEVPSDADSTKLSFTLNATEASRYWVCGYDSTGTWVRTSSSTDNNSTCSMSLSGISKIKLVIGYKQPYNLSPSDLISATLTIL